MIFCVFTRKQMYIINAAYFKVDEVGVMFFDESDKGIGFIPICAIEFIRIRQV